MQTPEAIFHFIASSRETPPPSPIYLPHFNIRPPPYDTVSFFFQARQLPAVGGGAGAGGGGGGGGGRESLLPFYAFVQIDNCEARTKAAVPVVAEVCV